MVTFENGMDIRSRQAGKPTVARFRMGNGVYRCCVIGTAYGYIHTSGGDVKTWGSYSGARAAARKYVSL